jgi:tRNA(adenine34) deaminase
MAMALERADEAANAGDVPVGCVIVRDGEVIGWGENRRERDGEPSAHAEIIALREAARLVGSWRLDSVTAYVTLEPCVMCAGALLAARVARVVIGARDEKAGAVGSRYNLLSDPRLLHEVPVTWDVLEERCAEVLTAFFQQRRAASSGSDAVE